MSTGYAECVFSPAALKDWHDPCVEYEKIIGQWTGMKTKTLKEKEKEHLREVLKMTRWDLEMTSRLLQIPLPQVKRKIKEHGFKEPGSR